MRTTVTLRPAQREGQTQETDGAVRGRVLEIEHLMAYYGAFRAIEDLSLRIQPQQVTAIIGPSGCGKSTLIRCLNRMHEVTPGATVTGKITVDGQDIYEAR